MKIVIGQQLQCRAVHTNHPWLFSGSSSDIAAATSTADFNEVKCLATSARKHAFVSFLRQRYAPNASDNVPRLRSLQVEIALPERIRRHSHRHICDDLWKTASDHHCIGNRLTQKTSEMYRAQRFNDDLHFARVARLDSGFCTGMDMTLCRQ
jgi:hypothetical protein